MPAKYERVKIKLPHAQKIHGKSMVFLLKEADTERRRRRSQNLIYIDKNKHKSEIANNDKFEKRK